MLVDFRQTDRRPRHFARQSGFAILALGLLLQFAAQSAQAALPNEKPKATESAQNDLLATVGNLKVTRRMLHQFLSQVPQAKPEEIERALTAPAQELLPDLQKLAVTRYIMQIVEKNPDLISSETLQSAREESENLLIRILERKEVFQHISEPSEKELREFYTANSEYFNSSFHCSIRHIFLSAYRRVEAGKGDTLESIAARVSGDASYVDRILVDNEIKSLRAPGYASGNRDNVRPTEPEDPLLVPLSSDEKARKQELAQAVLARLKKGEDFIQVAEEASDGEVKGAVVSGLGLTGRPLLKEVQEVAMKTEVGAFSDVFETRHGFNIIKVEEKSLPSCKSFEEAKDTVRLMKRDLSEREAKVKYLDRIFKDLPIKFDWAVYKNTDTPDDAVFVKLDGRPLALSTLKTKRTGQVSPDMSDEEALRGLKANASFMSRVYLLKARQAKIDESPEYLMQSAGLSGSTLADAYFKSKRALIEQETLSPKQAKEYFETHGSEFLLPETFTYCVLALAVQEGSDEDRSARESAALGRVWDMVRDIRDYNVFRKTAAEKNEDPQSRPNGGMVEKVPAYSLQKDMLDALRKAGPGRITEPMIMSGYAMVAWVAEQEKAKPARYEDVQEDLPERVRYAKLAQFPGSEIARILKDESSVVLIEATR